MNKLIQQLNRTLAERLGYIGANPRFAWKQAADLHYFYRRDGATGFQRFTWADQLGKVWVLAQWRVPTWIDATGATHKITPDEWWTSFHGEFPYPGNGMYYAHSETALPPERVPTEEMTAQVVRMLDDQIQTSYADLARASQERAEQRMEKSRYEWTEKVWDDWPAFGNCAPGTRGGYLSFGGIDSEAAPAAI